MRYAVHIKAARRFGGFRGDDKTLDLETAQRLARDAARQNGMIFEKVSSINGDRFTAIMRENPDFVPPPASYRLAVFDEAGLPLIAGGFIVLAGTVFFGLTVWNWTIESVTELAAETNRLLSNPLVTAGLLAVAAYVAVEAFKKWK